MRKVIVVFLLIAAWMGLTAGCQPRAVVRTVEVTVTSQAEIIEVTATPLPTPAPVSVTVCASDCDFATIQAAIDDVHTIAGSTINVTDAIHTEPNIVVNKDVTIQGLGADSTIVQAHGSVDAAAGRVFYITDGATVTIRRMTIRHGNPPEHLRTGGGIYNDYFCALTLQDSVVADNGASDGAGISNRGAMTITNCIVRDNVADGIEEPGHQCGNGGGIKAVATATTVIVNTTITDNHAVSRGGGIKGNCDGTMEIINSTISGNTAGSAIAGIYARGTMTITNSTIVGNEAVGAGRHAGDASGICVRDLLNLTNTIIANNDGGQDCGLCDSAGVYGSIGMNVNNLIGDGSCSPDYAGDPTLGPLADNDGLSIGSGLFLQTHALLPGSPAIDAISADDCAVAFDQRGVSRPQGVGCDIGAYELQTSERGDTAATPAPTPTEKPYEKVGDIPYADADSRQKLDVYLPTSGEGPFPILLAFHEGNFKSGAKADLRGLALHFAEQGYAVVTPNHRFTPQYVYPAQVQDAFCALAWVHANADTYDFDTGRIVALGLVSGGNLAAMLGVVDDPTPYMEGCLHELPEENWIQGVATFTGLFDFTSDAYGRYAEREHYVAYLGGELDEVPEIWHEASPINWVDGDDVSFLLIHGWGDDERIDSGESARFGNALKDAGAEFKLSIVDTSHIVFRESMASYRAVEALFARISERP